MPAVSVRLRSIAPRLSRRHALVRRVLRPAGLVRARVLLLRRLLRLLPQWDMGQLDIWAVTAQREALSAKVRQAIEVLRQYFAGLEGMQQSL